MNRSSEPSLLHRQPPENYAVIRLIRWLDNWLTRFVPQEVKKKNRELVVVVAVATSPRWSFWVCLFDNKQWNMHSNYNNSSSKEGAKRGQGAGKRESKEGAKTGQRGSKEGASTLPLPLTRHKECQKLVLQSTLSPPLACPWLCFKHLPRQSINK